MTPILHLSSKDSLKKTVTLRRFKQSPLVLSLQAHCNLKEKMLLGIINSLLIDGGKDNTVLFKYRNRFNKMDFSYNKALCTNQGIDYLSYLFKAYSTTLIEIVLRGLYVVPIQLVDLKDLAVLKKLDISNNNLDNELFGQLVEGIKGRNLSSLNLSNTKIGYSQFVLLKVVPFTNLQLDVSYNAIQFEDDMEHKILPNMIKASNMCSLNVGILIK